jgi:hypothetical protein
VHDVTIGHADVRCDLPALTAVFLFVLLSLRIPLTLFRADGDIVGEQLICLCCRRAVALADCCRVQALLGLREQNAPYGRLACLGQNAYLSTFPGDATNVMPAGSAVRQNPRALLTLLQQLEAL